MADDRGPTASPDQMATAGKVVAEEHGDAGVEMRIYNAIWEHRSWVAFDVLVDGVGRRRLIVSPACNWTWMNDGEDINDVRERIEAAQRALHIDARRAG